MSNFLTKMVDRIFAVAGAFLFCQVPEVMKQYTTLLSGHLSESKIQMNMVQQNADLAHKTVPEYIQKFTSQPDIDFIRQGEMLQKLVERNSELTTAYADIMNATIWTKPFVFVSKVQLSIFNETLNQFTPGFALNLETLLYAVVGICIGVLVYRLIIGAFKAIFIPKKENKPVPK